MIKKIRDKRLVLLDAHAIIHRAYHGLPDFSSSTGEPTGALYGLSLMLLRIFEELDPDYIAACFDLPKPTYRHIIYKQYKAGRKEADEELKVQIARARALFEAFSVPIYEKEEFEADDILGTIVKQLQKKKDTEIIIASGDMDTLQLVNDDIVRIYTLRRGIKDVVLYDEDAVYERYGFGPEYIPDYKGLSGDPSDNIIGVKGVGDKTARKLITTIGSIEDIYTALEKDEKTLLEKGIKKRTVNLLNEHKEEAQFSKVLATIRTDAPVAFTFPKERWKDTIKPQTILDLFGELEFRSLKNRIRNTFGGNQPELLSKEGLEEESAKTNVSQKDLQELPIMLWLTDSNKTNPSIKDVLEDTNTRDPKQARKLLEEKLKTSNLLQVYEKIEQPLIPIIEKMNARGVLLDTKFLKQLSKKYHKKLNVITKRIYKETGAEFNINSSKQLSEVLFETLNLPKKGIKKTSSGRFSTRESELEKLRGTHHIIEEILQYREYTKLLSTYIDALPRLVDDVGRLHTTFVQAGTTTGRIASVEPNLQNIPIRTDLGRPIRKAFVAPEGYKLAVFDYSQIELRIAAALSGDKKLKEVFQKGTDIHASVASHMFDVSLDEVSTDQRAAAKTINFGILYGMGVNALSKNLDVTRKEAKEFYDNYFNTYKTLASYIDQVKNEASRNGYTTTLFGRRRYFEGIRSRIPYIRAAAERMAINAPIQGTQADIVKLAMVHIDEFLKQKNLEEDVYLVLQVHDELVYEVVEEKAKEVVQDIKNIMESVVPTKESAGIHFVADAALGDNWQDTQDI